MIPILTAEQIRSADIYTIEHEPISSFSLMERAAQAFVNRFIKDYSPPQIIDIFCGYGNNGGDGLAIAQLLHVKDYEVAVYILADQKNYSNDFKENEALVKKLIPQSVHYLKNENDFPVLKKNSMILDGLFGSGLNRPLRGLAAALVEFLNNQAAVRIAIDIPSGLFADQVTRGKTVHARNTFTFQVPKMSFLFPENYESVGDWEVLNIGLNRKFIASLPCANFLLEKKDAAKMLHPRKKFDHKGTFGHAFIHAGNSGKMGAAILCSKACVTTGAGLTTAHIPEDASPTLNTVIPEVMTEEYSQRKNSHPQIDFSRYTACAFGPGIGTDAFQKGFLLKQIKKLAIAAVFDADALNILSMEKNGLKMLPPASIMTPHPKEFERLAGKTSDWLERHQRQIDLSKKYSLYIILKGAYTCITTPEGISYFNTTGNPGMAKGGSGDVLTGVIVSLLAQQYTAEEACLLGVYLHGLAGDIALRNSSVYSMNATDIIQHIGAAYSALDSE